MNDINERLAKNIRTVRKNMGFTQEYVAEKVGITKQAVCKIEKNGSVNQTTLEKIANVLFVDVHELYESKEMKEKKSLYEVADFLTIEEKDATIHTQVMPVMKSINDLVARSFASRIKENCLMDEEKLKKLIVSKNKLKKSYTPQELYDICLNLNKKFIIDVYEILGDTSNLDD